MEYFKINNIDLSHCVSGLKVSKQHNYNSQTNAAGDTVVDYINTKRTLEITFIPLNKVDMSRVYSALSNLTLNISYLEPATERILAMTCILPSGSIDYYTIQDGKVMYKPFTLTFTEL